MAEIDALVCVGVDPSQVKVWIQVKVDTSHPALLEVVRGIDHLTEFFPGMGNANDLLTGIDDGANDLLVWRHSDVSYLNSYDGWRPSVHNSSDAIQM